MKFKLYEGQDLPGLWEVSIKIDGVRCHKTQTGYQSRKGKELYNIPSDKDFEVAEIYCGSFKSTIEATRTFTKEMPILPQEVYPLLPVVDKRLVIGYYTELSANTINNLFEYYHGVLNYEGLVLKQGDKYFKVKPEETHDVVVTGIFEGKGKYTGLLGGFKTAMGNVGTGLTDEERLLYYTDDIVGQTIEVSCMQLTPDGKFRHPRFVRLREDK